MTTQKPQTKFTYEDYLLFPELFADTRRRHELINGEHFFALLTDGFHDETLTASPAPSIIKP